MRADEQEYVITSLERDDCQTEILTVELPSRELVAQLELPGKFLERMEQFGETYGVSTEQALAERLEINRARISLQSAQSVEEIAQVRAHLTDAKGYLSGVEALETETLEAEIERVWTNQLGSSP